MSTYLNMLIALQNNCGGEIRCFSLVPNCISRSSLAVLHHTLSQATTVQVGLSERQREFSVWNLLPYVAPFLDRSHCARSNMTRDCAAFLTGPAQGLRAPWLISTQLGETPKLL